MAMRWRWPPENSWGKRSAERRGERRRDRADRRRACAPRPPSACSLVTSGSAMMALDAHAWIERGEGVLEHRLDRLAVVPAPGGIERSADRAPRSGCRRRSAPRARARAWRSSSCRSRIRPPRRASARSRSRTRSPSTARTTPWSPPKNPRRARKCLLSSGRLEHDHQAAPSRPASAGAGVGVGEPAAHRTAVAEHELRRRRLAAPIERARAARSEGAARRQRGKIGRLPVDGGQPLAIVASCAGSS